MANGDNEKLEQTLRELINTLKDTSEKNRKSVQEAQKNAEDVTTGFLDRAKSFDEDLKKLKLESKLKKVCKKSLNL